MSSYNSLRGALLNSHSWKIFIHILAYWLSIVPITANECQFTLVKLILIETNGSDSVKVRT